MGSVVQQQNLFFGIACEQIHLLEDFSSHRFPFFFLYFCDIFSCLPLFLPIISNLQPEKQKLAAFVLRRNIPTHIFRILFHLKLLKRIQLSLSRALSIRILSNVYSLHGKVKDFLEITEKTTVSLQQLLLVLLSL